MAGAARIPGSIPSLLSRLGITDPALTFDLAGLVVPVSLVDTGITIPTSSLPPLAGAPASIGEGTHAINTVLADTGALAAGNWWFRAWYSQASSVGSIRFGKRNAANAAFVWSQYFSASPGTSFLETMGFITVADQERLRMEVVVATGSTSQGSIWATQIS